MIVTKLFCAECLYLINFHNIIHAINEDNKHYSVFDVAAVNANID